MNFAEQSLKSELMYSSDIVMYNAQTLSEKEETYFYILRL
jgi:hypothetical protein